MTKTDTILGTRYQLNKQKKELIAMGFRCDRLQRLGNQDWYILTYHWDTIDRSQSTPVD